MEEFNIKVGDKIKYFGKDALRTITRIWTPVAGINRIDFKDHNNEYDGGTSMTREVFAELIQQGLIEII